MEGSTSSWRADVRCAHVHTRILALLRNHDRADVVNSPAGSQRTAVHHVLYSHCHGTTYLSQLPAASRIGPPYPQHAPAWARSQPPRKVLNW